LTDKTKKTERLVNYWSLPIESVIIQIERVTNGEGIPQSDEPFSYEPPGIIAANIHRLLCNKDIPKALKARLKLCDRRMEYIVQPSWHEGYDACTSLKKRCQLEIETFTQTGHLEATYRYPSDKPRWYWFLAGWLSACRVK
jgi:hypothetical protein